MDLGGSVCWPQVHRRTDLELHHKAQLPISEGDHCSIRDWTRCGSLWPVLGTCIIKGGVRMPRLLTGLKGCCDHWSVHEPLRFKGSGGMLRHCQPMMTRSSAGSAQLDDTAGFALSGDAMISNIWQCRCGRGHMGLSVPLWPAAEYVCSICSCCSARLDSLLGMPATAACSCTAMPADLVSRNCHQASTSLNTALQSCNGHHSWHNIPSLQARPAPSCCMPSTRCQGFASHCFSSTAPQLGNTWVSG